MIPYYSSNFGITDLFKTLLCQNASRIVSAYFRLLTGKKYILITSSCRSALYLAYLSIGKFGSVHTSPLTCKVALLPILAANNRIIFNDIKANDWTLDPDTIVDSISKESIAIQAIHLGGFECDMQNLRTIADNHSLVLIEDCAQGFASAKNGIPVGRMGDIACFTLSKNVFGIGGGIFATDNEDYFKAASSLQRKFSQESSLKIFNRILTALLSPYRNITLVELLSRLQYKLKQAHKDNFDQQSVSEFLKELRQPGELYVKSVAGRIAKINHLNELRKIKAAQLIKLLAPMGFRFQAEPSAVSSFTKLFCLHEKIDSAAAIEKLNKLGIEAMHLEHKQNVYYQTRFDRDPLFAHGFMSSGLPNYCQIHDRIVSIPLHEKLSEKDLSLIAQIIPQVL